MPLHDGRQVIDTNRPPDEDDDRRQPSSLVRDPGLKLPQLIAILIERMRAAARNKAPLDLSSYAHRVITESLHTVAFEPGQPASLTAVYNDGSTTAKPFMLHDLVLSAEPEPRTDRVIQVGTLSFRHLNYDDHVQFYLLRDKETRRMTSAEIEAAAYSRMQELLLDPYLAGDSRVLVYQTGLEPLVFGLYRAVSDHLRQRRDEGRGRLVVYPVYYIRDDGRPLRGSAWTS